jgi:growth arrest-specific protein 8
VQNAIERFFDISKKELREVELASIAKEREMEVMNDNHRVEVKVCGFEFPGMCEFVVESFVSWGHQVYQQKVKHLEYEHGNAIKRYVTEDSATLRSEEVDHLR